MKFAYQAYTKSGSLKEGVVEAQTEADASEQLRKQGLFVSTISTGNKNAKKSTKSKAKALKKVHPKIVAGFARELAVLVSTGTPLIDAISSIERQSKNESWAQVLTNIRTQLEEGDSFCAALESQRGIFDPVFRSLVAAGESSGNLDSMLLRVSVLTRKQAQIRASILGAMMYPILLVGVALIVMGLLIGVVLPRFAGMFETLDTELPASTAFLMMVSDFVRAYWWGLIPGVIMAITGVCVWIKKPAGQQLVGKIAIKLPQMGPILKSFMTARITRLLGVLLDAKVPMIDAIRLTRESLGHDAYRSLMDSAEEAVVRGEPISSAFLSNDLMIPSACEAMRNAEQSGQLADVLVHISDYLDEDNDTVIKSISSLIEPVIMVALGILVGFVAVSMFLPLFDLTATAGAQP